MRDGVVTPAEMREALRHCTVRAALALAQEYFGFPATGGRRGVSLEFAHIFASRRTDLWDRWDGLPVEVHELCGRLWQAMRFEVDLTQREAFFRAAIEYGVDPAALFTLPEEAHTDDARWLVAAHAQEPLELANRLVAEALAYRAALDHTWPLAGQGLWTFGPDDLYTVSVPKGEDAAADPVVQLWTAPFAQEVTLPHSAVLEKAVKQAAAHPTRFGWKPPLLESFFGSLTDAFGRKTGELRLPVGAMSVLNAPTGVGKSVLMGDAAQLLAASGQGPVLVVVGKIRESLNAADQMEAEEALVHETAAALAKDAERAGRRLRVVPWVAPSRQREQAEVALSQGDERRFERWASGCEMLGWQVDGPEIDPGRPPCDELRWAGGSGPERDAGRHLCPRMAVCGRFDHERQAAAADIIVTNHHNLIRGRCKLPVEVDGQRVVRGMSVMEFVLRHCRVVIIDEIDAFQSSWCGAGSKELLLIARGGRRHGTLQEIDRQRSDLDHLANLAVTEELMQARTLSETFLDSVLAGNLWLETAQERGNRPGSGWYVPGMRDLSICQTLLGVPSDTEISEEVYNAYLNLFPGASPGGRLPAGWEPLAEQLARALNERKRADKKLPIIKRDMARILKEAPFGVAASARSCLINDLLVRTLLGSLQAALHSLKWATIGLMGQLPAAADIARTLGALANDDPLPLGALGSALCGFKIDKHRRGGRLTYQSLSGDPHTATVHLGNTVALATAGVRRSVLGLSATAYFPGAALQHIHTLPAYVMTDAAPGAVTANAGNVSATSEEWKPISIAGLEEHLKPKAVWKLAERLWEDHLAAHLEGLARNDPQRERTMLAGNSYFQAGIFGAALAKACGHPGWIAVLVKEAGKPPPGVSLPEGVVLVTTDELEDLPRTHPKVKVICVALPLVSRALNILIPGTALSALASVWVGIRPVAQVHSATALYASINAAGAATGAPSPDPASMLQAQRRAAFQKRDLLLRTDPRFSRMPRFLKAEVLAGILVELIQLAGRARRGGTPVELYLVDHAFFNAQQGDFPSLLRTYFDNLDAEQQALLRRVYGSTLTAWLDLAEDQDLLPFRTTVVPAPAVAVDEEDSTHEHV
ncbi:hypothetical protein Stsp01_65660 [Streptomyces sp. NBRC 13847]|nr:hypothetical protein Stsp01_65660 [Streptomyces sp. NBRC 13847]